MTPYIGYTATPEPWQYLYLLAIGLATLMLFVAIAKNDDMRHHVLVILGGLGVLAWWTLPGLMVNFLVHYVLLLSPAPVGASIIAATFTLFCWYLMMRMLFPRIWEKKLQRQ